MSTINLQGATSGQVAVVVPAVAGSNTFTIPAETGTARTTVSSGTVLQVVNVMSGAMTTGTTQIPFDDTIPQNTEGNEYITLAITPRSATSKLVIDVVLCTSVNALSSGGIALFQDSTASALAAAYYTWAGTNYNVPFCLTHYMTSGTTSSTTFKVRAGTNGADTLTLNGSASGRIWGGVMASSITITEVVP